MSIIFELCRTAQKSEGNLNDDRFLKPPKAEKQFLISPPASPPEGWKPFQEDGPCKEQPGLHFELVARLAALAEGQSHEIIEPSPIAPSIVLHACEVNLRMHCFSLELFSWFIFRWKSKISCFFRWNQNCFSL